MATLEICQDHLEAISGTPLVGQVLAAIQDGVACLAVHSVVFTQAVHDR